MIGKSQRKSQIMAEVKPHIDRFASALDIEVKLLYSKFKEIGGELADCLNQFYGLRGNPNSFLFFSYYRQPQNYGYIPHFIVKYTAVLATTAQHMHSVRASGLMGILKRLSESYDKPSPEYIWDKIEYNKGRGGIMVPTRPINPNNLDDWIRSAQYIGEVVRTVEDYIARNPVVSSIPAPRRQ